MDDKILKKPKKRQLIGMIVSDKMNKTAVVEVEYLKFHPKYKKYYKERKKIKAHNPENRYKKDEKVIIEETRPLSKDKRWRIIRRIR